MNQKVISIGRKYKINILFMEKNVFLFIALFIMDKGLNDLVIINLFNSRSIADFLFGAFKIKYESYKKYECEFYREYNKELKIHKFLILEDYELGYRVRLPFGRCKERVFRLAVFNEAIGKFELITPLGYRDSRLLNYNKNPDLLAIVDRGLMINKYVNDLLIGVNDE